MMLGCGLACPFSRAGHIVNVYLTTGLSGVGGGCGIEVVCQERRQWRHRRGRG